MLCSRRSGVAAAVLAIVALAGNAAAESFAVGPDRELRELTDLPTLQPGDIVEVDGDATYAGGVVFEDAGTADQPIRIVGRRVNGRRPTIAGN